MAWYAMLCYAMLCSHYGGLMLCYCYERSSFILATAPYEYGMEKMNCIIIRCLAPRIAQHKGALLCYA